MKREKKLKGGMLITARDIQIITGTENSRVARREHQTVRDTLGKKGTRLSLKEYCDYWELDLNETIDFLIEHR
jgi:hypothetical protein